MTRIMEMRRTINELAKQNLKPEHGVCLHAKLDDVEAELAAKDAEVERLQKENADLRRGVARWVYKSEGTSNV